MGSHSDDIVEKSLWIDPKLQHQRKGSNVGYTCILAQATTNKSEINIVQERGKVFFHPPIN